jgi:hypothetical protein
VAKVHVDHPADADCDADYKKAPHLEILGGGLVLPRASKNRPTLNQRLRLIAVGRSVGSADIGASCRVGQIKVRL